MSVNLSTLTWFLPRTSPNSVQQSIPSTSDVKSHGGQLVLSCGSPSLPPPGWLSFTSPLSLSLPLSPSLYMMFLRKCSEKFFFFLSPLLLLWVLQSVELKHTAVVLPAFSVPKGERLCMTTRGRMKGLALGAELVGQTSFLHPHLLMHTHARLLLSRNAEQKTLRNEHTAAHTVTHCEKMLTQRRKPRSCKEKLT